VRTDTGVGGTQKRRTSMLAPVYMSASVTSNSVTDVGPRRTCWLAVHARKVNGLARVWHGTGLRAPKKDWKMSKGLA